MSYRHFSRFPDSFPNGVLVLAPPTPLPNVPPLLFIAVQLEDCLRLFRKILIRKSQNRRNSGIEQILKMEVVIVEISYFQLALDAQRVVGFRSVISTRAQSHGDGNSNDNPRKR